MISSVGLYFLFAMLYLFYYHADQTTSDNDRNEDVEHVEDVENASIRTDKDLQDDAGDLNEFGTNIIHKKQIRKMSTSMRRIFINQVTTERNISCTPHCYLVCVYQVILNFFYIPSFSVLDANFIRYFSIDFLESIFATRSRSVCKNANRIIYN